MTYILLAIFVWFLYNFVIKFVVPIFITTRQVKRQFDAMKQQQEQYNDQHRRSNTNAPNPSTEQPKKEKVGEYIEFEEVK